MWVVNVYIGKSNRMKTIALFTFFLSLSISYAQFISPSNYDKFIVEVYGGTPYMEQSHKNDYISFMKKVEVKKWDGQNYPFVETIDLKNKYNPNLKYDFGSNFKPTNFNPLKYQFDFYQNSKTIYRVRDTDYMIVIHP